MSTALAVAHRRTDPMDLSLTPEFESAVRDRVESGMYASPQSVYRACIEALAQWEAEQQTRLNALRRDVDLGFEQIRDGRCSSMADVFERLRARAERSDLP